MFKQILFVQWKSMRLALLPLTLAAFALPLMSVQGTLAVPSSSGVLDPGGGVLVVLQSWLAFFPSLAALAGIACALSAWSWDNQTKHVYSLALPVSRQKYVLNKLGAGALLVAVPGVALWGGSLLGTAFLDLPTGLHAYPTAVAIRFLLASLIAYTTVFALSAWSGRSALVAISVLAGALLFADLGVTTIAATMAPELSGFSPTAWVLESMARIPGPFGIFSGNWALIDV